jgi:hypothetical protein
MNLTSVVKMRLSSPRLWLNPSVAAVMLLLQRTPLLKVFGRAESALLSPIVQGLRAVLLPAAAMGAVHSLAGATTQLVGSVSQPARATVGVSFTEGIVIQGLGVSFAQSWAIGNTLPPGITVQGAVLQGGRLVVNPSNGTVLISGTPTTAGTFGFTVSGYQFTNLTGPVTNATATIIVAAAPNAAPTITRAPASLTAVAGTSATLAVTFAGAPAPTLQWSKDGTAIKGATGAALVLNNVSAADAGNYTVTLTNSLGATTSQPAAVAVSVLQVAPAFSVVPVGKTAISGENLKLVVVVTGTPTPALQWSKDGVLIRGATESVLTLPNVQGTDAGSYTVSASNSAGTVVSVAAKVLVNPAPGAPVFTSAPVPQIVATGSTVVFSAPAMGSPAPAYQWRRDGTNVAGATRATLVVSRALAVDAGNYSVVASNAMGRVESYVASLTVADTADFGRLSNLSIRTEVTELDPFFTVGTVVGGEGTAGAKPLLIRAVGPSLAPLGVTGSINDPQLDFFSGQAMVASNDNWGGGKALSAVFSEVGAFGLTGAASKDAALFDPALVSGSYTVRVSGVGGAAGTVIAELYDATPGAAFTRATLRLINVSVLKKIAADTPLIAGFVIGGTTSRTVLVRAIGPTLGTAFGVAEAMVDPRLELFSGSVVVAANDNWGGDGQLSAAASTVGAFPIADEASKDAILLITLSPGSYTVQVSGGKAAGNALVEVYEVP